MQVTSLHPPWGTCDPQAGPYDACMAECRNRQAANMCGCKDVYMGYLNNGETSQAIITRHDILGNDRESSLNA